MTTIEAKHAELRKRLNDPSCVELDVEFVGTSLYRLGLRDLMVDDLGRFWAVSTSPLKMVFDPGPRSIGYSHGDRHEGLVAALMNKMAEMPVEYRPPGKAADPDDTQAAQGFPAKE